MQPYQHAPFVTNAKDEAEWVTGNRGANRRSFISYIFTHPKAERFQRGVLKVYSDKVAAGNSSKALVELYQMATGKVDGKPVTAFVEANRWIARCDIQGCGGAETVYAEDPEFYCFSCFNVNNNGYPRPVAFPKNYKKIEKELEKEPIRALRNWKP